MDINQLKNLVQLMVENDLTRVELREGETHILLRRGFPPVVAAAGGMVAQPTVGAVPSAAPSQVLPTSGEEASNSPPADPDEYLIRSPMVGTFYAQHDPESPPFVNVGDEVGPDTVVCLVEAMGSSTDQGRSRRANHEVLVKAHRRLSLTNPCSRSLALSRPNWRNPSGEIVMFKPSVITAARSRCGFCGPTAIWISGHCRLQPGGSRCGVLNLA